MRRPILAAHSAVAPGRRVGRRLGSPASLNSAPRSSRPILLTAASKAILATSAISLFFFFDFFGGAKCPFAALAARFAVALLAESIRAPSSPSTTTAPSPPTPVLSLWASSGMRFVHTFFRSGNMCIISPK